MPLEIRPATPDEFGAVGDLCVAAYQPFLAHAGDYVDVLRDAASRREAAELLVAVDEQLLGTITFVPDGGPLGEIAAPDETEFRMLAVSPAAQGRGVGTALLQHIVDASGATAAPASSARASPRCAPRTGSTSGSASRATRSATGHRCRASTCSPSRSDSRSPTSSAITGVRSTAVEVTSPIVCSITGSTSGIARRPCGQRVGLQPRVGRDAGQAAAGVGEHVGDRVGLDGRLAASRRPRRRRCRRCGGAACRG